MSRRAKVLLILGGSGLLLTALLIIRAVSRPIDGEGFLHERARSEIFLLTDVLDQYHHDRGAFPTTTQGLDPLVADGYLRKIPEDPWRIPYHYVCPGVHNAGSYDLWSTGADGRDGGEGPAQDVTNWRR